MMSQYCSKLPNVGFFHLIVVVKDEHKECVGSWFEYHSNNLKIWELFVQVDLSKQAKSDDMTF